MCHVYFPHLLFVCFHKTYSVSVPPAAALTKYIPSHVMTERLKLWPVWSAKERNTYTCMCRRAFICHREVCYSVKWAVIHQLPVKCLSALSAWCISAWHTVTYVAYLLPSRGLWVRGARKAYCKIRRSRKSWYFFCISQTSWWNIYKIAWYYWNTWSLLLICSTWICFIVCFCVTLLIPLILLVIFLLLAFWILDFGYQH